MTEQRADQADGRGQQAMVSKDEEEEDEARTLVSPVSGKPSPRDATPLTSHIGKMIFGPPETQQHHCTGKRSWPDKKYWMCEHFPIINILALQKPNTQCFSASNTNTSMLFVAHKPL